MLPSLFILSGFPLLLQTIADSDQQLDESTVLLLCILLEYMYQSENPTIDTTTTLQQYRFCLAFPAIETRGNNNIKCNL